MKPTVRLIGRTMSNMKMIALTNKALKSANVKCGCFTVRALSVSNREDLLKLVYEYADIE